MMTGKFKIQSFKLAPYMKLLVFLLFRQTWLPLVKKRKEMAQAAEAFARFLILT